MEYQSNKGIDVGFENLQICPHSVIQQYMTIIKHSNVSKKHTVRITFAPQEHKTMIHINNTEAIVIMRVIDEIIYFFDTIKETKKVFVTKIANDSKEMQMIYRVMKKHKKIQKAAHRDSQTVFKLEDVDIIMPRHSQSEAYIRFKVREANLTISTLQITQKTKTTVSTCLK